MKEERLECLKNLGKTIYSNPLMSNILKLEADY
jgi:hypothetical protein